MRVPPLAFWANERISRNATQTGGSAIEQGFSDQLAQACQSFTHSSPARKPKKVSNPPWRVLSSLWCSSVCKM